MRYLFKSVNNRQRLFRGQVGAEKVFTARVTLDTEEAPSPNAVPELALKLTAKSAASAFA